MCTLSVNKLFSLILLITFGPASYMKGLKQISGTWGKLIANILYLSAPNLIFMMVIVLVNATKCIVEF